MSVLGDVKLPQRVQGGHPDGVRFVRQQPGQVLRRDGAAHPRPVHVSRDAGRQTQGRPLQIHRPDDDGGGTTGGFVADRRDPGRGGQGEGERDEIQVLPGEDGHGGFVI